MRFHLISKTASLHQHQLKVLSVLIGYGSKVWLIGYRLRVGLIGYRSRVCLISYGLRVLYFLTGIVEDSVVEPV